MKIGKKEFVVDVIEAASKPYQVVILRTTAQYTDECGVFTTVRPGTLIPYLKTPPVLTAYTMIHHLGSFNTWAEADAFAEKQTVEGVCVMSVDARYKLQNVMVAK